ncbi:PAS domain S-box protein [Natrarchaeobius halalkaliphilus]|uniref:PAS domain S-box protein n=1 Tax=Natrarchaeobius halalkaliphilus TaxID=1679091 RepID=A0A3N6LPA7_9EURY|nr:bacterio-opsin activator domain-containing protein [Natrarchaeobius halalkaliphilus]RQG91273.1 PAS domain S-box protein [Natrarchaeobius halalkaliphilus]
MSNGETAVVGDVLRILVVGDSSSIDAVADTIEHGVDRVSLWHERTVTGARERLETLEIHCLVCEFDRHSTDPVLERLEGAADDVPILALTDGSDATRALEAGAADVVAPTDEKPVVATRVETLASRYRLATVSSDRHHRAILESAEALVWVVESDGTIAYTSPAVDFRMGYTPDELERTPLSRLVYPDDRKTVRETLESAVAAPFGAKETATVRLGTADGTWTLTELTVVNRLEDPLVDGLVVTAGDGISSANDEAVRASIDRLPNPVFALGPEWELVFANEPARRLFEGNADPGTVIWDLLPGSVRSSFHERLHEAQTIDSIVRFETADPATDGRLEVTLVPGDDGVTVVARPRSADAIAIGGDRLARSSELDAELSDRLDLLESSIDALEDGVAILEGDAVRVANAALFEMTDAESLLGRNIETLFDDDLTGAIRERSRSAIVRWMEPLQGTLETDGRRPVDVFVTPLPDGDRTLCLVRDRRRSGAAMLSTLSRTIRTLARTDDPSELRHRTVEAVRSSTGCEFVGWYRVTDRQLTPAAVVTGESTPSIDPPTIDPVGTPIEDTLAGGDSTVHDRVGLESVLDRSGIRADRVLVAPVDDRAVILAAGTDPLPFESFDLAPIDALVDAASVALDLIEHRSRLRAARREQARLESAVVETGQLRKAVRTLLAAESREDVERTLCEAVTALEPLESDAEIELAWVGRVDASTETIVPRIWAGRDGTLFDSASIPLDVDGPTAAAANESQADVTTERQPVVIDDLETRSSTRIESTARTDPSTWIRRLTEHGFRSALSVKIECDGVPYGTLTVYANQPAAFDDRLRRTCVHLSAVAGHAIGSIERKRALLTDSVIELEVVLRAEDEPIAALAHRLACRIDVRSVVPRSSVGSTMYATVSISDDGELRDAIDSVEAVDSIRRVGNGTDATPIEVAFEESTVAELLATHGGVVRSITPIDSRSRVVFSLPQTADVRAVVQTLERAYPGTELVARREHEHSRRPERAFEAELRDRLSERQLLTLETAYYSGFFEWPRESTGEEVATSLGVSQPTFSRHSRIAQQKLFELLFDERTERT